MSCIVHLRETPGIKNDTAGDKPFAAVETYAFDKNPKTIKAMLSQDNPMVNIVHLREIPGITL